MSKKRRAEPSHLASDSDSPSEDSLSPSSEEEEEEDLEDSPNESQINCDFEFFDPQKQDFAGIRHLLRQLFCDDASLFNLDQLTEIVLSQPLVGTTVKTEGHESDPLSLLTVLNLRVHQVFLTKSVNSRTIQ
jgi:protein BCP1